MSYNQDDKHMDAGLSEDTAAQIGARLRRYHDESSERGLSSDLSELLARLETSERRINPTAG